jgi:hypothetical protein
METSRDQPPRPSKVMLREMGPVRQVRGEPRRRWFSSERCDLIVWLHDDGRPQGFQFCYDKDEVEHAATWRPSGEFSHMRVDYGAGIYGRPGTPFLIPDGAFDPGHLLSVFQREASLVPGEIVEFVAGRLTALTATEPADE